MENQTFNETPLYSNEEFRRIIFLYQQLLNMLIRELPNIEKDLNIKGGYNIINIKRGLKDGSHQVFRDYLASTHGNIENLLENQFDKDRTFRCIKIIFLSGESITFINNPKINIDKSTGQENPVELPKGILCFDDYRKKLNDTKATEFDKLYMELNNLEIRHFSSNGYKEAIGKVIGSSENNVTNLYKDKIALALNLQSE